MSTSAAPSRRSFRLGLALALLPIGAYIIQFRMRQLWVPWYLPILGTVAALCMGWAVLQRRSPGRLIGLLLVGLLAVGEWYFFLGLTALPPYIGPVGVGKPFPVFQTLRADGTPFTRDQLRGDQNTVLLFFRGRW